MNSKRFFFVMLGGLALLLVLTGGLFYKADKTLHKEGDNLVELKLQKSVLDKQQKDLQQAKQDIVEYGELESITKSIVPQDKDQAQAIVEIANLANNAGISIGSIQFPESELGKVVKGAKNKQLNTSDSSTTQLTPVDGIKGVYAMEIKIANHKEIAVPYERIIKFLSGLENNRRTAQVTNLSINPDQENPQLFHFAITLNTYIRPDWYER